MPQHLAFLAAFLLCIPTSAQPNVSQSIGSRSLTELRSQIEQITRTAQGRVGVVATRLETGESVAVRGNERFPMQSVYKFPIGMAVLRQIDEGKLTLTQRVRVTKDEYVSERQHSPLRDQYPNGTEVTVGDLLRYAVSESDGSASDVLLRIAGGAPVVMRYLRSLGVTGVQVLDTEQALGRDQTVQYRNWAQPVEAVKLLRTLQEGRGLSKHSRALLLKLMTDTPTGLRRLKGQLPAGTVVAHKTGTSLTLNGQTAATNDIGLITLPNGQHLAVAVFIADAKADEAIREEVIAQVAKAVWTYWQ